MNTGFKDEDTHEDDFFFLPFLGFLFLIKNS